MPSFSDPTASVAGGRSRAWLPPSIAAGLPGPAPAQPDQPVQIPDTSPSPLIDQAEGGAGGGLDWAALQAFVAGEGDAGALPTWLLIAGAGVALYWLYGS